MSFISGKVALITGGASGIGFCYAKELLKNDLKAVALADIDPIKGEEAVKEITNDFGPNRVIFLKTDVTVKQDIEDAFQKTIDAFKNLDIVINNAGIMNDAIWEKEIAINLNAPIYVCLLGIEKYLPKYKTGAEAVIVNISSLIGLTSHGSLPVYAATKHGIIALASGFGDHTERTNVRILTICPGVTDTPLITESSLKNLGEPYEKLRLAGFANLKRQTPEVVAEGVMNVIEEGETGSIWVIDEGKTTKVTLPHYTTLVKEGSASVSE